MIPTNHAISAAMRASPNTPRAEIIKILTAATSMPVDLPPFPWHVREAFSGGRNPVAFIYLEGSDGREVCTWMARAGENIGVLKERARFLTQAAEAYLSNMS
jgi:hypothetical protein